MINWEAIGAFAEILGAVGDKKNKDAFRAKHKVSRSRKYPVDARVEGWDRLVCVLSAL